MHAHAGMKPSLYPTLHGILRCAGYCVRCHLFKSWSTFSNGTEASRLAEGAPESSLRWAGNCNLGFMKMPSQADFRPNNADPLVKVHQLSLASSSATQMVEDALKTMFAFVLSGTNSSVGQNEYLHGSGTALVRVDHNRNVLLWMPQNWYRMIHCFQPCKTEHAALSLL